MMWKRVKRVFISYGAVDDADVASWLSGSLAARGYQVIRDKELLRETTGVAWDRLLEETIRTSDVVVALMSPHSVRPEGECRNEIAFAKDHGKPIVPVMVRQCERPLRIHDLQYVDLEAFPRVDEEERTSRLNEIIRFIENGVPVDSALSVLRQRFRPLDYERVLRRKPSDPFTGREWFFERIDQWLADPYAPSTLFVVGGPGVGKTSAMAHWCCGRLKVGAYHFCDQYQPDTAREVVASLAGQLLSLQAILPSKALHVLDTAGRHSGDAGSGTREWTSVEWFRKLVLDPLRNHPPVTPLVLVIDALDESIPDVQNMFRVCHKELPEGIRLVITSRKNQEPVTWFRGALEINATSEDNRRDLRKYVDFRLQLLIEQKRLEVDPYVVQRFVVRMVDASAGTFSYCVEVLDSIAYGQLTVSDDTSLPMRIDPSIGFTEDDVPVTPVLPELSRSLMRTSPTVFISYRRDDSQDVVGRIYDRLVTVFLPEQVIRDIDSLTIGQPFPDALNDAVERADVVLVIIGKHWLHVSDSSGARRLDDSTDFVRMEIERAFASGKYVVPVLVSNSSMPLSKDLPESIQSLVKQHGIQVRPDPDFHGDMDRLIRQLNKVG
jgi:hypothetical protein